MSQATVLILDDDPAFARAAGKLAYEEGCQVQLAHTLREARAFTREHATDLIILDLNLPDGNGLELIDGLDPDQHAQVAVVTGAPTLESAVRAIALPVVEYLVKPFRSEQLQDLLRRTAGRYWPLEQARGGNRMSTDGMAGNSPAMRTLRDAVLRVAASDAPVLLVGEAGTGKRRVAQSIHEASGRGGPFLVVDCAALSPGEQERRLFGTGQDQEGALGRVDPTCTVLVHGVDALAPHLQVRLLAATEQDAGARLLFTVDSDPATLMADGGLREDLYYGISGITIPVPALRERGNDVIVLADLFIRHLNAQHQQHKRLAPGADQELLRHPWPGNLRELRGAVQRAHLLQRSELVRIAPRSGARAEQRCAPGLIAYAIGTPLAELERQAVRATLAHFGNDKPAAARALGISVRTVYNHIARTEAGSRDMHGPETRQS